MKSNAFAIAMALALPSYVSAQTAAPSSGQASGQASVQAYPDRPIRMVLPYPPGGSTDFTARILAQRLPAALGQSIVIDNRGGGGGNIGNAIVAKAAPDGYTLLVTADPTITMNPSTYSNLPYNALRDLPAITQLIHYAYVVVLHPSVPATSIKE